MVDLKLTISTITVCVNGLSILIKSQRLSGWIIYQDTTKYPF